MAVLNGKKDRVDGLTRVPFVCAEGVLRTKEQLQQFVLTPIGAKKPDEKLADLKPEMIKVKAVAKPKSADPRMAQWLDEAGARVFVEVSLGEQHTVVLFLTKGSKPKVVGIILHFRFRFPAAFPCRTGQGGLKKPALHETISTEKRGLPPAGGRP